MIDAIESAMATAYKRSTASAGRSCARKLDLNTGTVAFEQVKTVVDETTVRFPEEGEEAPKRAHPHPFHHEHEEELAEGELPRFDPEKHILLEDAKLMKRDAELGEEIVFPLEPQDDFGRIAAQTAKQVIIQKIREAEKLSHDGGVRREEGRDRPRHRAAHGARQYLRRPRPRDRHHPLRGADSRRALPPRRAHPRVPLRGRRGLPRRLPAPLARAPEVPRETLRDGGAGARARRIEVKAIAREPGSRTKIAVASIDPHVDPVGSLVGQRGVRVSTVISELGGERIDIIEWNEDAKEFVKEALSPAALLEVELDEDEHRATVTVAEDQQSLAIGRGGQNVRLAAKLTGWNIDIVSMGGEEVAESDGENVEVADAPDAEDPAAQWREAWASPHPARLPSRKRKRLSKLRKKPPRTIRRRRPALTGEQDAAVAEDDAQDNDLPAEEELTLNEDASIVDQEESRDTVADDEVNKRTLPP